MQRFPPDISVIVGKWGRRFSVFKTKVSLPSFNLPQADRTTSLSSCVLVVQHYPPSIPWLIKSEIESCCILAALGVRLLRQSKWSHSLTDLLKEATTKYDGVESKVKLLETAKHHILDELMTWLVISWSMEQRCDRKSKSQRMK